MKVSYYRNLDDLPLYNWRKYNETGDKGFLVKSGMFPDLKAEMNLAWYNLNDEYLVKFCDSHERNNSLKKRKKLVVNLLSYVETGNMMYKMEADIIQAELLNNAKALNEVKSSFLEVVAYAEKYFGFQIDERKTSSIKFFTYLESMKKQNNGKEN